MGMNINRVILKLYFPILEDSKNFNQLNRLSFKHMEQTPNKLLKSINKKEKSH